MTLQTRLMDARREGYKEGEEFGMKAMRAFMENPDASDKEIAELLACDVEKVAALRQTLNH